MNRNESHEVLEAALVSKGLYEPRLSELRALRRERDAERRAQYDRDLVAQMTREISRLFPGCPPKVTQTIAEHTARRGSGRVGRTAGGQSLEEEALILAVVAHIRHRYTNYDELLMSGYERSEARAEIHDEVDRVLDRWRNPLGVDLRQFRFFSTDGQIFHQAHKPIPDTIC